ncbi:hypothetical protein E8E14_007661 [Neopestalotiopsis sp. 37M]|nr:hypothetical protein E8E14_007661 [Neopestalotiopsis sp. 37M]
MQFSPDGRLLASASDIGSVIVWRSDTGEHKHTLEGQSSYITALDFSPDNKLLVSASDDGTMVLWTTEKGERWQTIRGYTEQVEEFVFLSDGTIVARGWDGETWAPRAADAVARWQMPLETGHNGSVESDQSAPIFAVAQSSSLSAVSSDSNDIYRTRPNISLDKCWICHGKEPILWLPPEYRPFDWAVSGHTMAYECESGRVLFVRLSDTLIKVQSPSLH